MSRVQVAVKTVVSSSLVFAADDDERSVEVGRPDLLLQFEANDKSVRLNLRVRVKS